MSPDEVYAAQQEAIANGVLDTPRPGTDLTTPAGYEQLHLEQDRKGIRFLYMGDNWVAFTDAQWQQFLIELKYC